jgi:hypothetical protein
MDPNVIVVPIHVHVFTDTHGHSNNNFMGGLPTSSDGPIVLSTSIRNVFDEYAVKVLNMVTTASHTSWQRLYTTRMTRNITDTSPGSENNAVFDSMLAPCQVQTRLASVDFIAQPDGLENAEIVYGSSDNRFPVVPSGDPVAMAHAALMDQYILAMSGTSGAHVFVVGNVNPGMFVDFNAEAGIGWDQNGTAPGNALISGLSPANASESAGKLTLEHEVGHVLGLKHWDASKPDVPDGINAMFSHTLTPDMCAQVHSGAQRLVVPASSFGCSSSNCFGNAN